MNEVRQILKSYALYKNTFGLLFGTLYSGRNRVLLDEHRWPILEPKLDIDRPELPVDWEWGYNDDRSAYLQVFCSRWFQIQHGLEFKHPHGGDMPDQILWLLSSIMQNPDKSCNYRNYQAYRRLEGLKFLPFLVDQKRFRFHVYQPTEKRVTAAIKTFQHVLDVLKDIKHELPTIAALIHAMVRLVEVTPTVGFDCMLPCLVRVDKALDNRLGSQPKLGLVYGPEWCDLQGPQDAIRFIPS